MPFRRRELCALAELNRASLVALPGVFYAMRTIIKVSRSDMSVPRAGISARRERSDRSRAFEALWRSLPRDGLIPPRSAFDPARAGAFLRNLILVEGPGPEQQWLKFRLVGDALTQRIGVNLTGADYLDFLPAEQRAESLEAGRLICSHPCGIWQLNPVHFERGFSQTVEATIFPLGPASDGAPLMLGCLEFLAKSLAPVPTIDKAVTAETSAIYDFIDIGAGVPKLSV